MGWTKFLREHTSPDNSCALSQSDKTASKVRLVTMAIARASLERCLGHERACNLKPVSPPSGTSKDSELLELLPMVGCVGWDWLACSCQDASCRIQEHNQTHRSRQHSISNRFSSDVFQSPRVEEVPLNLETRMCTPYRTEEIAGTCTE